MLGQDLQPEHKRGRSMRLSELASGGVELCGVMAVFCLGGWWLDRKLGNEGPWLLLAGSALGILGAMYKIWRMKKRFFG
jgi:hypothetical protein